MTHDEEKREAALQMVRSAAATLMEHLDSVQIVATERIEGGTRRISWGGGNYYARVGSVREWLAIEEVREDEENRLGIRAENEE
jgi:hypothetical protein